jgi:hypothetical protein
MICSVNVPVRLALTAAAITVIKAAEFKEFNGMTSLWQWWKGSLLGLEMRRLLTAIAALAALGW